MKQSLFDRVANYLAKGRGMQEVPCKSAKYRKFVKDNRCYFVGRNGACRAGDTASNSVSITDMVHRMMKVWEKSNDQG